MAIQQIPGMNKTIFQSLPVKDLLKADYNRPINPQRVKKIVNEYDEAQIGALRVNKRNGKFYVVDGQHRLEALKALGIRDVMCEISFGLTYQEEAYLYVKLDKERHNLNWRDTVIGLIKSGDKKWISIKNVVEGCGLKLCLEGGRGKDKIAAFREVAVIYDQLGDSGLRRICNLLKKTYDGSKESLDGRIFAGMRVFVSNAGKFFEDVEFINKMKSCTPLEIILEARRNSRADNIAKAYGKAILYYYNYGRRSKKIPDDIF